MGMILRSFSDGLRPGFTLILALCAPVFAQVSRRELFDSGAADGDQLGSAVTATALYTLAGAPGDDTLAGADAGSVTVFHASTGRIYRKIVAPSGAAGDAFGTAVAASGDYLVVGAPKRDGSLGADSGMAYIFRISTGALIRRLEGDGEEGELFGASVAIWGNHIVVGAPDADEAGGAADAGKAWLFNLENSALKTPLQTVVAIDAGSSFGKSVAVDNNLIAVGAPNETRAGLPQTGSVYLFTVHPVTGAPSEAAKVFPFDAEANDGYGWALALHGNTMVVGSPFRTVSAASNAGRVLLHENVAREIAGLGVTSSAVFSGSSADGFNGFSVAISSSLGTTGLPWIDSFGTDHGSMLFFANNPLQPISEMYGGFLTYAPDLHDNQLYGWSTAAYGNRLVIGAPGDGTNGIPSAGLAYQAEPLRPGLSIKTAYPTQRLENSAPGTGGATYASFSETVVGTDRLFVLSSLSGPGVTTANGMAIFCSSVEDTARMMRKGSIVAPGLTLKSVSGLLPGHVSTGVQGMAVLSGTGVTSANDLAVFQHDGTTFTTLLREGAPLGPSTLSRFLQVRSCNGWDAAAIVGLRLSGGVTAASDSVLHAAGTTYQEGTDSSSVGPAYGQFSRFSMTDRLIYPCALQSASTADNALLESRALGGAATKIARKGEPAPAAGGTSFLTPFQTFLGEVTNLAGGYAFRATMASSSSPSVTVANNEGLWANNGPGGAQQLCVRKGASHPQIPGVTFKRFLQFGIDSSSEPRLIFLAQLQGTGVTSGNDLSLWLFADNTLTQLLREGEFAPGNARGRIGMIQRIDIHPETKTYAVLCSLTSERGGISSWDNQTLLTGYFGLTTGTAPTSGSPVLSKGQRFLRSGTDLVQSISFLTPSDPTGALACGLAQTIDANRIACQVQFSRGDKEIIQLHCNP
jgi:hypothetical protein